ncbi:cupin domain-containing protein [Streptomyces sp. NPDC059718]
MKVFRFERGEWAVTGHGSTGLHATRLATGEGPLHLTCLSVEPGGVIGTHPAPVPQMFLVIAGEGWIAGPDGNRVRIAAGQGVRWEQGEDHTSGTDVGFTALAIEGASIELFEPTAVPNPDAPDAR